MDLIRDVIYKQNNDLLKQIADDFYPKMTEEQNEFINKFNKKILHICCLFRKI